MTGIINKIETMGLLDGPGIRTVIFMQGCPLRCLYCHNPEMQVNTGGKEYSVKDIVDLAKRYKSYYGDNGGITFSGGEPLNQSPFLLEVCKELKKENINICLDTSGYGKFNEELLDYIDLVILDIKDITSEGYLKMTTRRMEPSLDFIKICNQKHKRMWLRQVIVPSINDSTEYILALKEFIKKINNVEKIELLPYHTMGVSKYDELNINYPLKGIEAMDKLECEKLEKLLLEELQYQ